VFSSTFLVCLTSDLLKLRRVGETAGAMIALLSKNIFSSEGMNYLLVRFCRKLVVGVLCKLEYEALMTLQTYEFAMKHKAVADLQIKWQNHFYLSGGMQNTSRLAYSRLHVHS